MSLIRRIYVEKKKEFNNEAETLHRDLVENLGIKGLKSLRKLKRYDIAGITEAEYLAARSTILSEPPLDHAYDEELPAGDSTRIIAVEYLPGQYDQRADSAAQCIQIITLKSKPVIAAADIFILQGTISDDDFLKIKKYLINPVDSREASLKKTETLVMNITTPPDVEILTEFIHKSDVELEEFRQSRGLAISLQDLQLCRHYFKEEEKRNPTITEIKMLDTYWSDHCRHTTFNTHIDHVEIEPGHFSTPIARAYEKYLDAYNHLFPDRENDISLMNIALMSMKEMRAKGKLTDLEVSDEINACSIVREMKVNGQKEKWLIMFKNETHNHPTEIEPFGGAATCLGGAIRDPLSGRAFVYQAMRVTGSGNPCRSLEDTLPGKLPQRKITTEAAHGYSSYGNQIGLATGLVSEIYDDGYIAKRMEVGAVIGAVPQKNVIREEPAPGDIILLVGGQTGRDGIGGATGSSKEHTEDSIYTAGAEVQKGNPPEERKLQRLFRNPEATQIIKRSNDFGAGGVSVAIGELADGLEINLDAVPKKYEGLDGTELALSESQERMAVVVAPGNVEKFKNLAAEENLETTEIARVTSANRLKMSWRNANVVDISRAFIDTHGVRQTAEVSVTAPEERNNFFANISNISTVPAKHLESHDIKSAWLENLKDLNTCSQLGLVGRFDGTVGAGSVLLPFGGEYQASPTEAMAAKIPVLSGDTTGGTVMSYGFNPVLSKWSPFHGAVYAVVEAAAKIVAVGGDYTSIRMSLQEYFEKLGHDPKRWGKPFSALLGAYHALTELQIAAIGGKDSMSGSFKDLDVPPTLIAFAVDTVNVNQVISPEFKNPGHYVVYVKLERDEYDLPCFDCLRKNYAQITEKIKQGKIISAHTVRNGGIAAAVSKMAFGNRIGFSFEPVDDFHSLFIPDYGSLVMEVAAEAIGEITNILTGIDYRVLGRTIEEPVIKINNTEIAIEEAFSTWEKPLEAVFPAHIQTPGSLLETPLYSRRSPVRPRGSVKIARPRVLITAFPGTNCEYDTKKAFEEAGAIADIFVFRNLTPADITSSLERLRERIANSQIVAIPGGFSAGDEPDGSGKFITAVFRNPHIREAVMELLKKRDGLMIGICNGFQALIKLGFLPYGEIRDIDETSATLTYNWIGRHVSRMVRVKVVSVLSPWFSRSEAGVIHTVAVSHGEGRFIANNNIMDDLIKNGQIASQYVDLKGNPTMEFPYNPNGSMNAVEAITSPDGRILGKMGHSERRGTNIVKNVPGNKDRRIFASGVDYFG